MLLIVEFDPMGDPGHNGHKLIPWVTQGNGYVIDPMNDSWYFLMLYVTFYFYSTLTWCQTISVYQYNKPTGHLLTVL